MAKVMLLHGHILRLLQDADQEDSEYDAEEEDEEEPQFLDMDEMQSVAFGSHNFRRSITPSKEVTIVDGEKKYTVTGQFLLTDPWWKVKCKVQVSQVRKRKCKYRLRGYQAYTLKTSVGKDILSLFLTDCGVAPDFKVRFSKWLDEHRSYSLPELPTILKKFGETHSVAADHILPLVEKSDAFAYVNAASKYPLVMEHLPTLLPQQFKEILRMGTKRDKGSPTQTQTSAEPEEDTSLLARLEKVLKTDAIKTDVWKLGFKYVLHHEFKIVGCEATLNAFKECDVFEKIPQCQQHALLLYDHLKKYFWHSKSTYIELNDLTDRLKSMDQTMLSKALDFLRMREVVICERTKVMLQDLYTYETGIASCLQDLVEAEPWHIKLNVEEVLQKAVGSLDLDQVRAAKMICSNPVTLISGKGGCGKTTLVKSIFEAAKQNQSFQNHKKKSNEGKRPDGVKEKENSKEDLPVILLTAPTGRAAALLSREHSPAYTLHQVLYSFYNRRGEDSDGAQKLWRFSDVQVLVVDEGSLVGVRMLYSLLCLLTEHAQLRKFIILGDVSQLPSIEPGNVLNDLFIRLSKVNCAIEMRTNHRAESKLIVENAGLISEMGKKRRFGNLKFDATLDFNGKLEMPSSTKKFILVLLEKNSDVGLGDAIKKLLEQGPGLDDDGSSQFVAFRKNVCALINELCCKHYSEHCTKTHGKENSQLLFQCKDKVCCTRNGYVVDKDKEEEWIDRNKQHTEAESKERSVPKERLCNGEIFFIKEDKTVVSSQGISTRYLTLKNKYRKVTTTFGDLRRECRLQHAWARTIHTFQGSEVQTIVYVLGAGHFQTWRHVYTAVTRGRKRVYLVTEEEELKKAIEQWDKPRKTLLGDLLGPVLTSLAKHKRPSSEGSYGTASKKTRDANDTSQLSSVRAEYTVFKVGDQVLVETSEDGGRTWAWSDTPFTVTEVIALGVKVQGRNEFISHNHLKMHKPAG